MKSFAITDVGLKRKSNQDFVYASDHPVGSLSNLYIVADGMGGYKAGDLASRLTVETMVDYIQNSPKKNPVRLLEEAIQEANVKVWEKSRSDKNFEGMGTTVVAGTVWKNTLVAANVGDSRLYLQRDKLWQVTVDHSLVEEMIRAGEIRREEGRTHPDKNIITRAVGVRSRLHIDFFDMGLSRGDRILLCSDGLCNMVEDENILQVLLETDDLDKAGKILVNLANRAGGKDNISVVLAEHTGGV